MNNLREAQTLVAQLFALEIFLAFGSKSFAATHYVDASDINATPPYLSWFTAATNIQNAVDAAVAGDEIVVTNGIYADVDVNKAVTVRSVNGAQFTTIDGGGNRRCVHLVSEASLLGFTLTHGAGFGGGGAFA